MKLRFLGWKRGPPKRCYLKVWLSFEKGSLLRLSSSHIVLVASLPHRVRSASLRYVVLFTPLDVHFVHYLSAHSVCLPVHSLRSLLRCASALVTTFLVLRILLSLRSNRICSSLRSYVASLHSFALLISLRSYYIVALACSYYIVALACSLFEVCIAQSLRSLSPSVFVFSLCSTLSYLFAHRSHSYLAMLERVFAPDYSLRS
jgi:hypothetical protein